VVHDSPSRNRRHAERDLSIYFDYLDGLAPKYLAKKHGITKARIYQILKEMSKESGRII
jgi:Mor family transcriptional regulator